MRYVHHGLVKKKPLYTSKAFGFGVYWSWRWPFLCVVKYEMWGEFGSRGYWMRSR